MKQVKIGLVGCGGFGNVHLDNLLKMEGVKIEALVSTNADRLQKTGLKAPDARLFHTPQEMFEQCGDLDAAFVCVPPDGHGDTELLAAQHGVHLYIEKPVEISLEKAKANAQALKAAGVITSCGYHERYNSTLAGLKEYLADQQVGLVSGQWSGGMPGVGWWRRKERSGGQMVEQCTHILDLLRYFFGEAESVYGIPVPSLMDHVENFNIEAASSAVVRFKNGVAASVQTACYFDDAKAPGKVGLQIYCKDSRVEYDWMQEVRYIQKERTEILAARQNSHFKAAQAFVTAVQTGDARAIRSPYEDGVKSLALSLAINESIRTGAPVQL